MKSIVILTGAGISADSGLSTFRDSDGLWNKHKIEDVATYEGFYYNPKLVYNFYNDLRKEAKSFNPNEAHYALEKLEKEFKGKVTVITQNIDDFHNLAGSKNLIHMHGHLNYARCQDCMSVFRIDDDFDKHTACENCKEKGHLRPHIVWFGEMPMEMIRIEEVLSEADLFVAIGTSGLVYPAAGFVSKIKSIGLARTVEINIEPSENNSLFEISIKGRAKDTVPAFVDDILNGKISFKSNFDYCL